MTAQEWITLVIAVLGALHGPITQTVIKRFGARKDQQ
jgi:hypothetical protein